MVADWYELEHHHRPQTDWMIFTIGIVPAISSIVRHISHVGDNVLVQEPVYNIFYNSILNNGRHALSSNLVFDGKSYSIDWDDLEKKLAEPNLQAISATIAAYEHGHEWLHALKKAIKLKFCLCYLFYPRKYP